MQDKHITKAERLKRDFFGKRFTEATLANIILPERHSSERILAWIKQPKNFLVIIGNAGTSKTHISAAIVDAMHDKCNSLRGYDERELFQRIRNSFNETSSGDYIGYLRSLIDDELLILDDIGSSGYTEWREEVLMEAIDFRYREMMPTVITSNLSKKEFNNTYHGRITSRLFATENTIIDLEGMPDLRAEGK